ncbi:MAG TPA: hypothetical protein VHI13_18595 [Candidatus Kapabacteria bacterium]|nr:hypothetical protein [Candidatus Kapabacteria bacterium]
MKTCHDAGDRGARGREVRECNEEPERTPLQEEGVRLTEEEVQRLAQSLGQAYVTMESAGRYVEEQERAPAAVALVAALAAARRELAAVLVRLLAGWIAVTLLGDIDVVGWLV